jgi:hypothetical protein
MSGKQINLPGSGKRDPVMLIARGTNTAIAAVLRGFTACRYSQPDQARRSGIIEMCFTVLLTIIAHLIKKDRKKHKLSVLISV